MVFELQFVVLRRYRRVAGKSVVVLESRVNSSGQTGRTTGHLMLWNDDYYYMQEQVASTASLYLPIACSRFVI